MQTLKDEVRHNILDAALNEFFCNGYDKATLSAIAKRCMISKSNLYNYFTSKEQLYQIILSPAISKLKSTAEFLTNVELLSYPLKERPAVMTKKLAPILYKYKKQVVILFRDSCHYQQSFQSDILEIAVQCFQSLNDDKMSPKFPYVLGHMLLEGISIIISQSETEEELTAQILTLFHYHLEGICGLA